MGLVYFIGLALLILAGYLFGRSRAAAAARVGPLHSRPAYHGAFVAIAVLAPCILIFAVAVPVADRIVEHQALTAFDPMVLSDPLRRGAACVTSRRWRRTVFRRAHAGPAQRRRDLRLHTIVHQSDHPRHRAGIWTARDRLRIALAIVRIPRPQSRGAVRQGRAVRRRLRRGFDDHRDPLLGAF